MRRSSFAVIALLALGLSGCSGAPTPIATPTNFDLGSVNVTDVNRNGVEFLTGDDALAQALAAARTAGSVTMVGSYDELLPPPEGQREPVAGLSMSVELSGTPQDFTARLATGDLVGDVRVTDDKVWATGSDSFLSTLGPKLPGETTCRNIGALEKWQPIVNPVELISSLLKANEGSKAVVTVGAVVDDTIELVITNGGGVVGTLIISAVGPPLPISLTAADASGSGRFSFSEWGTVAELPAIECH